MGLLWNPQSRDMGVRFSKEERIGWCQLWLSERRSDLNPWVWEGHSPCKVWGFRGHSLAYSPSNPHHSVDNRLWLFWGFEVLLLSTNRYTERWQHNVFILPIYTNSIGNLDRYNPAEFPQEVQEVSSKSIIISACLNCSHYSHVFL